VNKIFYNIIKMVHKGGCLHGKKKKGTHKMPDGTVMSGKTHSKDSKPVKKKAKTTYKKKAANPVAKKKPAKKVVTPARTFNVRSMYGHNTSTGH